MRAGEEGHGEALGEETAGDGAEGHGVAVDGEGGED